MQMQINNEFLEREMTVEVAAGKVRSVLVRIGSVHKHCPNYSNIA